MANPFSGGRDATPLELSYACLIHRKRLTMDIGVMVFSGEFQLFAVACRPRLSSIPDLGARPPSQACPRPAVKFVLTNASFQCRTFGFADLDHLLRVRAGQLTPAGDTAAAANLPRYSRRCFSVFRHCLPTMAGEAPALQLIATIMHHKRLMMHDQNSRRVDSCPKREVRFGETPLQRTRSDGQAFKPPREAHAPSSPLSLRRGSIVDAISNAACVATTKH